MPENDKIIKAEDAEEGKVYLSSVMKYKIKIIKKFFTLDGTGKNSCQRVTVSSDSYPGTNIDISGGTELIEFDSKQYTPYPSTPSHNARTNIKSQSYINNIKENVMSTDNPKMGKPEMIKMGKPKMSKIIYPMLESGNFTPEQIAEEVVKEFPERGGENLSKLISMIKGQYTYDVAVKKRRQSSVKNPSEEDQTSGTVIA